MEIIWYLWFQQNFSRKAHLSACLLLKFQIPRVVQKHYINAFCMIGDRILFFINILQFSCHNEQ